MDRAKRSHEETYRNYRVIGGRQGTWHVAVAYEGPKRAFAATCEELSEAIAQVKEQIDDDLARRPSGSPEALECTDLVTALNLSIPRRTQAERHVIERVARLGEATLLRPQLRGQSDLDDVSLDLGITQLGRRIAKALEIPLSSGQRNAVEARQIVLKAEGPDSLTFHDHFVAAAREHAGL